MALRWAQDSDGTDNGTPGVARLRAVLDGLPYVIRPTVGVVIVARDAEHTIAHLFARLPRVDEVVLVDLGSTDETVRVARSLWTGLLVVDAGNSARGQALRAGSLATSADIVVLFDGDGAGDLAELPRFLQALLDGADVAKGTRFASGDAPERDLGNGALLRLANAAFGTTYSDIGFGFYAFWRSALDRIVLDHDGVATDALLALRAARAGLLIAEVSCGESPRLEGHRRRRPVRDRVRLFRALLAEYASSERRGLVDLDTVSVT